MARKHDYDCQRCGACCCNLDQNREIGYVDYVEVKARDLIRKNPQIYRRFVVVNDKGEEHMKMDANERCAALRGRVGRSVGCSIYEYRPGVCRKVQPGSEQCLVSRKEHGLEVNE